MKGGKITVDEPITFGPIFRKNPKNLLQSQNKYLQMLSNALPKLIEWTIKNPTRPESSQLKSVMNDVVGKQINLLANIVNHVEDNPTTGGKRKKQRSRSKHR